MGNKVALVTGASSGMGRETVLELKKRGFIVYGGARRVDKMKDLENKGIHALYLDVTDDASMVSCVEEIVKKEGRIDVLVNSAGYGSLGAIEDVDIEEARHQFEVNLFGLGRMCQLVLPVMRKHDYGKIVNISSMGGRVTTLFAGWYYASKFAVEGFSDTLRMEAGHFGVDVILVEPGLVKSEWNIIALDRLKKETSKDGAYAGLSARYGNNLAGMYSKKEVTSPQFIAKTIGEAVTARKPKTRYLIGYCAKLCVFLNRLIGDRNYDKLIQKIM